MGLLDQRSDMAHKNNRISSDKAQSGILMWIATILIIAVFGSVALDVANSVRLKKSLDDIAQQSATASIAHTDSSGSITPKSLERLLRYYKEDSQRIREKGALGGRCDEVTVDGVKRKTPYFEVTVGSHKNGRYVEGKKYFFEEGPPLVPPSVPSGNTSIDLVVHEASPNKSILVSMASGKGLGLSCQEYRVHVGATTFQDNSRN